MGARVGELQHESQVSRWIVLALIENRNIKGGQISTLTDHEELSDKTQGFKVHKLRWVSWIDGYMFLMTFWSLCVDQCLSNLSRHKNHLESLGIHIARPYPDFLTHRSRLGLENMHF